MSDQMEKLLEAMAKQTRATQALTRGITALAKSNLAIVDALAAEPDEAEEEDGAGCDMSGKPIRVS